VALAGKIQFIGIQHHVLIYRKIKWFGQYVLIMADACSTRTLNNLPAAAWKLHRRPVDFIIHPGFIFL
jgi:hypothetical protein